MKLKLAMVFLVFTLFASIAYADSAVQIEPRPAYDNSTLHCVINVDCSGFTYDWYKNSHLTGINSAYVNRNYTSAGDTWKCVAKKYYPIIGWVTIGHDSTYINEMPAPENNPPVVNITSPQNNSIFEINSSIFFSGTAVDPEDGNITNPARFTWSSSLTGIFANDNNFNYSLLHEGLQKIKLTVFDSQNLSGKAFITINITLPINNQTNQTNHAPFIEIIHPADGRVFLENNSISFEASASDAEDGILTGNRIKWYDNGNNFANSTDAAKILALGNHTITAVATDSDGASSNATVHISVISQEPGNNPPSVDLIYPLNSSVFRIGDSIHFRAAASDPEDGTLSGNSIEWYSSLNGFIGYGTDFTYSNLSNGTHTITVYAFDSNGLNASESVSIFVNQTSPAINHIPNVSIITPLNGAIFLNGTPITFEGYAYDEEDGTNLSVAWYSSINGTLGTSRLFSTSGLGIGIHIITFNATDSKGATGTASITINVSSRAVSQNNAPSISILAPANNSVFANASYVLFRAQATDPEDGVLTGNSVRWYSSIDNNFANGTDVLLSSLSPGIHNITAVAYDSQGLTARDQITITITISNSTNLPPTAVIVRPRNNSVFGNGTAIRFEGSAVDPEQGFISNVEWYDNSNPIGNNLLFTISNLSVGMHEIRFTATDSQGTEGSDSVVIFVNAPNNSNLPPEIRITSPANNSAFELDNYIIFNAQATDPEDGILTGNSIKWYDNGTNFANGTSLWINSLSIGIHNITAVAEDSESQTSSDSINVRVYAHNTTNNLPFVNITAPHDGAVFRNGTDIIFIADAYDPEDGILTGNSLVWADFFNGVESFIGTGNALEISNLSVGNHTITVFAFDSNGGNSNDSISIGIVPQNATNQTNRTAPVVHIITPADGSNFSAGQLVGFAGTAVDADGNNIANLQWVSDVDGIIGNTSNFTASFTEGIRNIAFVATDSFGLQGFDTVVINVINASGNQTNQTNQTNGSAFVKIINPANGATYNGNALLIVINSSDYSNVTYSIDTLPALIYSGPASRIFSNGLHTIAATSATPNGTATDSISFSVNCLPPESNPPSIRLFSPGDGDTIKTNTVDFKFNASDDTVLGNCTLVVSGSANYNFVGSAHNGMNTFTENINGGDYSWQVICSDIYSNTGYSEKRRLTVAAGNFTYYQPPLAQKINKQVNELLIRSVIFDEYASPGDMVPIDITLANTGDFDINNLHIEASIYDLDVKIDGSTDINSGKQKIKILLLEVPEYAKKGVYDLKISAGNEDISRIIYREIKIS